MFVLRLGMCATALLCAGVGPGTAQSVSDMISKTGRVLARSARTTEAVLSNAASKLPGAEVSRNSSTRGLRRQVQSAPPAPKRRPRAWDKPSPVESETVAKGHATTGVDTLKVAAKASGTPPLPPTKLPVVRSKVTGGETKQKNEDAGAAKIQPDVWSDVEINLGRARCRRLLKQVDAVTVAEPAIKKGPCGNPAPVKLISLGTSPQISISPPAVVNCDMVLALYEWLENDLQPLAKKHLGGSIITIENMSSYSCRNAYGRKGTRLSEHARANALDIRGFVTSRGKHARVLAHWGPTRRAIAYSKARFAKQKEIAAKQALEKAKAEKASRAATAGDRASGDDRMVRLRGSSETDSETGSPPEEKNGSRVSRPVHVRGTISEGLGASDASLAKVGPAPHKLGGPKAKKKSQPDVKKHGKAGQAETAVALPKILRVSNSAQAKFLRATHRSACRRFGTVLGPEANHAHRNHFHVDLAPRKRGNFCE